MTRADWWPPARPKTATTLERPTMQIVPFDSDTFKPLHAAVRFAPVLAVIAAINIGGGL
jgi:hypothetical protein